MTNNKYILSIKNCFSRLNAFEITLLVTTIIVCVTLKVLKNPEITPNSVIALISTTMGVLCVVLGAKGSMANWIFGVIECFLYTYLSLCDHIYGDALQRIVYTLPMQFIGWHMWSKRERNDHSSQIKTRYMTWPQRLRYALIIAVGIIAFGMFLKFAGPHLTDLFSTMHFRVRSNYASEYQLWCDSATTILAIITTYISVKAFAEQWVLWLLINILSIIIWASSPSDYWYLIVVKYVAYTVNCFYGIYMWNKLSKS